MSTFCIRTMGGLHARWLPSDAAARELWLRSTEDLDEEDRPDAITFERSTECDGAVVEEHTVILEGGHVVARVWPEPPAFPEPAGPPLHLRIEPLHSRTCNHLRLTCGLRDNQPIVACPDCFTYWTPE